MTLVMAWKNMDVFTWIVMPVMVTNYVRKQRCVHCDCTFVAPVMAKDNGEVSTVTVAQEMA